MITEKQDNELKDVHVEHHVTVGCGSVLCRYPHCLHMLELLQYEHFRKELVNAQCAKFIDEQQLLHWQHYSRKRTRLQQALAEQQQPPQQPPHGNAAAK